MNQIMAYFDLGLLPSEALLGDSQAAEQRRRQRDRQRRWLTVLMYFGVFLGVLSENIMQNAAAGAGAPWENMNSMQLFVMVIVTFLIFPHVVPKVFGRMEPAQFPSDLPVSRRFIQFCLAFQQGFFWPAFLFLAMGYE